MRTIQMTLDDDLVKAVDRVSIPPEVFLSKTDGMPRDCAVNCDHLQTVSKGKIGSLITSLRPSKMYDVGRVICFALDI